jgi:hypothetical protein
MSDVASAHDGQAPARRFGALVAGVVVLCACACAAAVWAALARDGLAVLQTSLRLGSGETTTGTVVQVEEFEGVRPSSGASYKLIVEYEVDGDTYTLKSHAYYPARDSGWLGEAMPVVYDPAEPAVAQIDTFNERWLTPFTSVIP